MYDSKQLEENITLFLTSQAISLFGPLADVISIRVIMGVSGAAMPALVFVVFQYKTFYEAGKKNGDNSVN